MLCQTQIPQSVHQTIKNWN